MSRTYRTSGPAALITFAVIQVATVVLGAPALLAASLAIHGSGDPTTAPVDWFYLTASLAEWTLLVSVPSIGFRAIFRHRRGSFAARSAVTLVVVALVGRAVALLLH